jgi:inhibitor of KinA
VRPRICRLGEETWVVEFEPRLDPQTNDRVLAMARAMDRQKLAGVLDVVPAIASLAVHVDGDLIDEEVLSATLDRLSDVRVEPESSRASHDVPVCYERTCGPDLEAVAEWSGCSTSEVIARHSGIEYRVFMIGFLPGFAYLGTVDDRIAAPRRAAPRLKVPAGSVGIAARQTGVYPLESPGGWQIVGRTPIGMFDPRRQPPVRMQAGDRVRFVPIDSAEFARLAASPEGAFR